MKEQVNSILLAKDSSMLQALQKMDETYSKLLIIVDGEKFINVLSIGDIQRALLSKKSLNINVMDVVRPNPTIALTTDSKRKIKAEMLAKRIESMPLIDGDRNLVDVLFWHDLFPEKTIINKALEAIPLVIMAGGQGTRLRPITHVLPKPLIPLGNESMIESIIRSFTDFGINKVYTSVNYKHEMIEFHFAHIQNKNYLIEFFLEDMPLGTAGSLLLMKDKLASSFFVSNCDVLLDQDFSEVLQYHQRAKNDITIISALSHHHVPYGVLEVGDNGKLESIQEKPTLTFQVSTGVYILEPKVLEHIPTNTAFDFPQLLDKVKKEGRVGVFPISEDSWLDIGQWDDYQQALLAYESRWQKHS